MTECGTIIAILSLCIVAFVVIYVRHKQPKETAKSLRLTTSARIKESREVQRGVEGNATKSKAESDDFPEPANKFGSQVLSEDIEITSEESGTQPSSDKYPTDEEGQEGLTAGEVKKVMSIPLDKRPPRRGLYENEQKQTENNRLQMFKPDIICWKRERVWVLAVEIPDDPAKEQKIIVLHNNTPLKEDSIEKGCWLLSAAHGEVVICRHNNVGENKFIVSLGNENYLLFKLSGEDLNHGRRVRHTSSGSYLIITSEDLEIDNEFVNIVVAAPEPVSLKGYQAYFFYISKKQTCSIVFHNRHGKSLSIGSSGQQFDLLGKQIPDASVYEGPLFGGSPPRMSISNGNWKEVGTIVVGEEGRGKGTWCKQIKPRSDLIEQELPVEITERKAGWYFVRLYDLNDKLIDSLDFRFVLGLRRITIHKISPLPLAEGHRQSNIDFYYEQGYSVQLFGPCDSKLTIKSENTKTTVSIPAMPEYDRSRWRIGYINGPMVPVTILLERVWWALSSEQQSMFILTDQCLFCTRQDLLATKELSRLGMKVPLYSRIS